MKQNIATQNVLPQQAPKPPGAQILEIVCTEFGVTKDDIRSRRRNAAVPRHITMALVRKYLNYSHRQVGTLVGRHYSTIIYGIRKFTEKLTKTSELTDAIQRIEIEIKKRGL